MYNRQKIRFVCADCGAGAGAAGPGRVYGRGHEPSVFYERRQKQQPLDRALSRHEAEKALDSFLAAAFQLLDNGGRLFLIYPAAALCDLFSALRKNRLEPKRLRFVYTKPGNDAARVLVEAKKLGRAGLMVEPAVWMQDE